MLGALEIIHCDHFEMLVETARVFERSVQVKETKMTMEIDRVAVELEIFHFELIERDELRTEPVAAQPSHMRLNLDRK